MIRKLEGEMRGQGWVYSASSSNITFFIFQLFTTTLNNCLVCMSKYVTFKFICCSGLRYFESQLFDAYLLMFFGLKSNACVPHINIPVVKISQIKCMQKPRAIDQRTRCFTNVSTESLNAELGGSGFCEAKSGLNMAIYSPAGLLFLRIRIQR